LLAGALFPALVPLSAQGQERLVLNTGTRGPFTSEDKQGFLDLLIKETFRRIGVEAEVIVYQASARAMSNANQGIDDGATLRVKGLEKFSQSDPGSRKIDG